MFALCMVGAVDLRMHQPNSDWKEYVILWSISMTIAPCVLVLFQAAEIGPWELCTNNIIYYHDAGSMIPIHRELTTSGYRALIYRSLSYPLLLTNHRYVLKLGIRILSGMKLECWHCEIWLLCSGDHDMCVPYTGSEAWTLSLGYEVTDQWRAWFLGHEVAG